MTSSAFDIQFDYLISPIWIAVLAGLALLLLTLSLWRFKKILLLRIGCVALFLLALANPSLLEEVRTPAKDVVVIVKDQSPSQSFAERTERSEAALTHLKESLSRYETLDVRIIEAPAQDTLANETLLFDALRSALSDVPPARRGGVIFISDGQIHDVPHALQNADEFGPIHLLLSGTHDEKDRQITILEAPSYGLIGQSVTLRYKIEDTDNINETQATVTISNPDAPPETFSVPTGTELTLDLPVTHAGQNVFEISVNGIDNEITEINNKAALIVNGVRDRLKVLLVSGKPHAGGRTWRDLLTADPGVDLVHFTILREPDKMDATPQNELSLIAFPFRELFEIKLYDFDLIIFDRYQLNRILPENYFNNIVRYVEQGGALLEASGPAFAGNDSLYYTNLMQILPGAPTGDIIQTSYRPARTENGNTHPVTKNLLWSTSADGEQAWGHWLRQVDITPQSGDVLMTGVQNKPLLILDRVQEGRVAQIASDQIWLWSRGYDGGGPHAELLKRIVHWLMKEPELDEKALSIQVDGRKISLSLQDYNAPAREVTMTKPDGQTAAIVLSPAEGKLLSATINADQLGIYEFQTQDKQKRYAAVGELSPPELTGIKTTEAPMHPILESTGGGALWLVDTPQPRIRYLENGKNFAGRDWIALRKNNNFTVSRLKKTSIFSPLLTVLMLVGFSVLLWWRESRKN
ncbi:MAG: hypothetical protein KDJ35_01920 [Alphaproteobacteria bacterium]|nr:hypothetical protein [Alphaproteobacteria bacterium]